MFLRGYGSQEHVKNNGLNAGVTRTNHISGNLGEIQGDAIRAWKAHISSRAMYVEDPSAPLTEDNLYRYVLWGNLGPLTKAIKENEDWSPAPVDSYINDMKKLGRTSKGKRQFVQQIDTSYVTASANETRPVNISVNYLIKVK